MQPDIERTIATHAARQIGLVTRDQLLRAGLSRSSIWRRTQEGLLIAAGGRTFSVGASPPSDEQAVLAACLDHGGVATHRAGCWLRGLWSQPSPIEITVPRLRSSRTSTVFDRDVIVHTTTSLPLADLTTVRGVPTVSVARSLLGLGALVPGDVTQDELAAAVADACERGLASERWLLWLLERRRIQGRNGVIAFEEAIAARLALGPTESWLERELVGMILAAGLPRPVVQRRVRRQGRFVGRVDLAFDGTPVVVEALGYAHHRSRADLERDTRRVNQLTLAGKRVLQFGYDQIVRDKASVLVAIADALGVEVELAA
ncbi:type IV toxin-antitoxin system AbiEi family antitoxin domain-containing protein [Iamia sp. SCSIO 61187]|uniref:type IV toxin-antitoxin system AbiEi family antitoxin domain-containing protein n=1 Tax=Iamia sp. SCSIO 61187 TaxID=2722752 RepID=UPI001C62BE76|nr:type IV toxin-antitoxin system AbiEi family antitoxin domain-containing protein [Iamia sp. SCSIO 61187]QYG94806.1 type IV toxin-antitoxin system AbiEi family antitoxin domain-containing protein [Iamia sp. SCSIO 61187]